MGDNLTDVAAACRAPPEWGVSIGVCMGVFGSIGINIGQNLQASGLRAMPEEARANPCSSSLWRFGTVVFFSFSLINFSALALAPASILTPIESIQFVTNIVWNRVVNRAKASRRMHVAVVSNS